MKGFLVSTGSSRRLAAGVLSVSFQKPWNFLHEVPAEARSAEANNRTNQIWWS